MLAINIDLDMLRLSLLEDDKMKIVNESNGTELIISSGSATVLAASITSYSKQAQEEKRLKILEKLSTSEDPDVRYLVQMVTRSSFT